MVGLVVAADEVEECEEEEEDTEDGCVGEGLLELRNSINNLVTILLAGFASPRCLVLVSRCHRTSDCTTNCSSNDESTYDA
jgi:hypothetical protein